MSQYVYNKHNTTWKVLCMVFTHSLFLYQKSQKFLIRQQLVRKYRTPALSMKYSLFPVFVKIFHLLAALTNCEITLQAKVHISVQPCMCSFPGGKID